VNEAVIVSTARTGLGKSWKGAFNMTYGATLGAHSVQHAVARAGIDPAEVEDVIMGSTFGEGTTGGNIARQIALRAGLPITTAGLSINRFCSSGLQSIALAAQRVMTEGAEVIVAGGLESISCVQNEANTHMRRDPWIDEHKPTLFWSMLQTAETVAKRYNISKEAQAKIKAGLGNNPLVEIFSYPGCNHAFARHKGVHYDAAAAKLANSRTHEFFDRTLR